MRKLTEQWLRYAADDLRAAEITIEKQIYTIVCFHSQQCMEKGMKAVMEKYNWEAESKKLLDLYGQVISD